MDYYTAIKMNKHTIAYNIDESHKHNFVGKNKDPKESTKCYSVYIMFINKLTKLCILEMPIQVMKFERKAGKS